MSRLSTIFAKSISGFFHPLIIPVYSLLIYFFLFDNSLNQAPPGSGIAAISLFLLLGFVGPVFLIFLMIKAKMLDDFYIKNHRQRLLPLIITSIMYGLLYYVFLADELPMFVIQLAKAALLMGVFAATISFFWKISLHAMGAGAWLALTCFCESQINEGFFLTAIIFVFGIIICWSRIKEKAHHRTEVVAGFLAGLLLFLFILFRS